jgi:hypothetical protein
VAGGQGTTATTGYVGGGGGEVRRSSRARAVLIYAEDNLNEEWSSVFWVGSGVETKGGRCFNVSRQGGGRKVTWWASIRAGCAIFCGQTLFCDWHEAIWWQGVQPSYCSRVPYLQN